jgi:hypothetical protein
MKDEGAADEGGALFALLLEEARSDPRALAFWLGGSRGKGRATPHSDFDCGLILVEEAIAGYQDRFGGAFGRGLDLTILTLEQFEALGAWGSKTAWRRYDFAHLSPLVDRTGRVATLMRERALIPAEVVDTFIRDSLDHFVNQIYRALKCRRDGDPIAASLEAADAAAPLLDALFALNGRRLRPYYKYLAWELTEHALGESPWSADELPAELACLAQADPAHLRDMFRKAERQFRRAGYGETFDAWGDALEWMAEG